MIARSQKYSIDFLGGSDSTGFPDYTIGDVNFDSSIDIFDLMYIVDMHYGFYTKTPPGDINEDSEVNFQDVMALIYQVMNYSR